MEQQKMNNSISLINHAADLVNQERHIHFPFKLLLKNSEQPLLAKYSKRLIPKKRLIVLGTWRSQTVVAKIFFTHHAYKHALKETQGIEALNVANILTPKLLYQGPSKEGSIYVLIFEAIQNAHDIYELCLQQAFTSETTGLLSKLITCIAAQHNAGLLQKDLHPDNFLFTYDKLYTIDGGSIKCHSHAIALPSSINQIALLLAQFPPSFDQYTPQLWNSYMQARGWETNEKLLTQLKQTRQFQRKKRLDFYLKKIMRNCSDFIMSKSLTHRFTCRRSDYTSQMQTLLMNIESAFRSPEKVLKAGRSSTVILYMLGDQPVVIKRFNIKSPGHYIKRCLQSTRAFSVWRNAHHLTLLNISTPRPIAFFENRLGPLRGTSYFISEFIPGDSLLKLSLDSSNHTHFNHLAEKIQTLLHALWQQRISHGDLKSSNILLHNNQVYIIDLDAMRCHKRSKTFSYYVKKDFQRFLANWKTLPQYEKLFTNLKPTS